MVKSVLICLDAGAKAQPQLAAGLQIARELGAAAQGLCIVTLQAVPTYAEVPIAVEIYEQELQRRRESAQALERQFADAARKAGAPSEWRTAEGGRLDIALAHGRTADLVVLSQDNPDEWVASGETEELVLTLGRPALLIPYVGAKRAVGGKAVVAWNGSREAARAVHDALPLLTKASSVVVLTVDSRQSGSAERLLTELARNDVKASHRSLTSAGVDVGDILLNAVADEGADLLVMGAYGHSRVRELILGGATRTVFRHMTAPTLLSH